MRVFEVLFVPFSYSPFTRSSKHRANMKHA